MTYEEAIKVLTDTRVMILKGSGTDLAKACSMAIESLEKQIPKKPIHGHDEQDYIRCSNCNYPIATMEEDILEPYCPQCGQKIKWGE